ncbi:YigZ family protein [Haloplasma contractile]|uniref:Thymidylate synthase protein n=1 Tax=Haloplasma contractile SSD-17B TaxID=1033810 RepID=U2DSC0_9MOLU|nr:YigZ family protein [Haloplasma contractile]ERJ11432.1 thymidylate synthase protein [Haloplasma contractile SSD-17B]
MSNYLVVNAYSENEIIIDRSRFICYMDRAETVDEAQAFINKIKKKHSDASHNCSCYIVGQNKLHQKANDDGEPSGTAGVPMLEVLKKNDITDTVCVVTRYFGGIKLGAGGLIRAYGSAVSDNLKKVGIAIRKPMQVIEVIAEYSLSGLLDDRLSDYQIKNKDYLEKVYYYVIVDADAVLQFKDWLVNLTSNQVTINEMETELCEVPYIQD